MPWIWYTGGGAAALPETHRGGGNVMRILIVEDEARLAGTLLDMLTMEGYAAEVCRDGESGLDNAMSGIYDAIVLDVMLPRLDGFTLLKRLRQAGVMTPVMMLTARGDLNDRIYGLDSGADYYLTKPFENAEFLACLRAVSRRQGDIAQERIPYGDLTLTPANGTLRCGERCLTLSARELEIMRLLMLNHSAILSKETLLVKVWGYDTDAGDNNVEAYISFLRKKLTLLRPGVSIAVVRRLGYRLEGGEA